MLKMKGSNITVFGNEPNHYRLASEGTTFVKGPTRSESKSNRIYLKRSFIYRELCRSEDLEFILEKKQFEEFLISSKT